LWIVLWTLPFPKCSGRGAPSVPVTGHGCADRRELVPGDLAPVAVACRRENGLGMAVAVRPPENTPGVVPEAREMRPVCLAGGRRRACRGHEHEGCGDAAPMA